MKTTKIKFYENKEKRTIVAVVDVFEVFDCPLFFPKTIRAKAKCHAEDKYDSTKGKQLATKRLKAKLADYELKVVRRLQKDLEKKAKSVIENAEKSQKDLKDFIDTF